MAEILTTLSSVGSTLFEIAGTALNFVIENPICLLPTGVWLIHRGVGVVKGFVQGV